jgi:hypothetical protein
VQNSLVDVVVEWALQPFLVGTHLAHDLQNCSTCFYGTILEQDSHNYS